MARGHYDYLEWAGKAGGGEQVNANVFGVGIAAGVTATINLPVVPANQTFTYGALLVTTTDDTSIHYVDLFASVAGAPLIFSDFINCKYIDIPGYAFGTGETMQVRITNNSAGALTFECVVWWIVKPI